MSRSGSWRMLICDLLYLLGINMWTKSTRDCALRHEIYYVKKALDKYPESKIQENRLAKLNEWLSFNENTKCVDNCTCILHQSYDK